MKASKVQEAAAEARRFLNRVDRLNYLGEINYEYDFVASRQKGSERKTHDDPL